MRNLKRQRGSVHMLRILELLGLSEQSQNGGKVAAANSQLAEPKTLTSAVMEMLDEKNEKTVSFNESKKGLQEKIVRVPSYTDLTMLDSLIRSPTHRDLTALLPYQEQKRAEKTKPATKSILRKA